MDSMNTNTLIVTKVGDANTTADGTQEVQGFWFKERKYVQVIELKKDPRTGEEVPIPVWKEALTNEQDRWRNLFSGTRNVNEATGEITYSRNGDALFHKGLKVGSEVLGRFVHYDDVPAYQPREGGPVVTSTTLVVFEGESADRIYNRFLRNTAIQGKFVNAEDNIKYKAPATAQPVTNLAEELKAPVASLDEVFSAEIKS